MRSRKLVIGLGLLTAVVTSAPAFGQAPAKGEPYPAACAASSVQQTESEKAHAMYGAGKVQYDEKNYEQAIQQFRDAYKRDCSKHDLLVIISRAYELNGNKQEALRALEMYMERVPGSPDATSHRTGIENLKRQIAKDAAAAAALPAAPPPTVEREHTIPPWIVVGIGGAAILTGAIVYVSAPKLPGNCDAGSGKCKRSPPNESDADFAKDQDNAGVHNGRTLGGLITIIGGVGIVGVGLLWHFLEPTGPEPPANKVKLTPQVTPGFAGASLGGTF